ncbi:hypothetical protein LXL04_024134 [Taraxacum kok-saghyz]
MTEESTHSRNSLTLNRLIDGREELPLATAAKDLPSVLRGGTNVYGLAARTLAGAAGVERGCKDTFTVSFRTLNSKLPSSFSVSLELGSFAKRTKPKKAPGGVFPTCNVNIHHLTKRRIKLPHLCFCRVARQPRNEEGRHSVAVGAALDVALGAVCP